MNKYFGVFAMFALASSSCRTTDKQISNSEILSDGAESIQPLSISCSVTHDQVTTTLTFGDSKLTVAKSSPTAHYAPEYFTAEQVAVSAVPAIVPLAKCESGQTAMVLWKKLFRINGTYYRLTPYEEGMSDTSNLKCKLKSAPGDDGRISNSQELAFPISQQENTSEVVRTDDIESDGDTFWVVDAKLKYGTRDLRTNKMRAELLVTFEFDTDVQVNAKYDCLERF